MNFEDVCLMNKEFKGVWIPREVWLNSDLKLIEKTFLVEIASLDNINGCYASNSYFSDFFDLSKTRCSAIIKSLQEKGYITIRRFYEDGKKYLERRIIKVNEEIIKAKCDRTLREKFKDTKPKESESNIEIENIEFVNIEVEKLIDINKNNEKIEEIESNKELELGEEIEELDEVIDLNETSEMINKEDYHSILKTFMCRNYRTLSNYIINYLYWVKWIKLVRTKKRCTQVKVLI